MATIILIPAGSQSNAAQNIFVPSNAALPRAVSTLPSTLHYSAQNPMVMSYATERSLFNAMNIEQQSSPLEVSDQISFTKQSHSAFSKPDVFGQHVLTTFPNLNEDVMKYDTVKEEVSLIGQSRGDRRKGPYQSFIETVCSRSY
ncbi:hypothetical protein KIN20_011665 [Parelaphostrongylus tenuis]|uniref:Uncharacterized protein n=1 Tax=Parelaphostrongylus tenuis TaxID=148309 RepID=A0AAD5QM94_PARTN|nr:hypothetical protein KIN20_011665 [Parelaphostrongylus tenuis]